MECPVCFEVFHNPLLLPGCGHTICQACAEQLVTEGNFLRCPECRLVYQLRRGVRSLPKNVALQRTIEERDRAAVRSPGTGSGSAVGLMCDAHPDDAVSLYCKTCEKAICLKCYFSNTLRKGETMHSGHQVDTSEDTFSKEKRLLEEKCRDIEMRQRQEREYITKLEETESRLKSSLEEKLAEIERNKSALITLVKQTSAKLKFTLNGSVARDIDYLKMSLESARERLSTLDSASVEAATVLDRVTNDCPEINLLKSARKKLEEVPDGLEMERLSMHSFSKVDNFDTDIQGCLADPKKALSYQTECPRTPTINVDDCVISNDRAHVRLTYSEAVRVRALRLFYRPASGHRSGQSDKDWDCMDIADFTRGVADVTVAGLRRATTYKMFAVASNDIGESRPSDEIWFRTIDCDSVDLRVVTK